MADFSGEGVESYTGLFLKEMLAPNRYLWRENSASKGGGGVRKKSAKCSLFSFDGFPYGRFGTHVSPKKNYLLATSKNMLKLKVFKE